MRFPTRMMDEMDESGRLLELLDVRPGSLSHDLVKGKMPARDDAMQVAIAPGLVEAPHIDVLLKNGYQIAYLELERLRRKAIQQGLTPAESQMYERYVKSLRTMAQEERDQRQSDSRITDKMTYEQLAQQALEIFAADGKDE